MDPKQLFRKSAIDKLSSPEQLDVLSEVTSPRGWLALWTIGAMLLGVLLWGVFGSIPTRVEGQGILIRGGGLREVASFGEGVLAELHVRVNDLVQPEQVLGTIAVPAFEDRIRTAQLSFEQRQRDYQAAEAEDNATIDGHQADLRRTRAELAKLSEELQVKRRSFQKGLITRRQLLALERDKVNLEADVTRLNATIRQIEQRLRQRQLEVDSAKREWEELASAGARSATLVTSLAGRVVEIKKNPGDQLTKGEVVIVLEPLTGEIEPVVYVSAAQGKQIRPGMEAQIAPTTVKREEYGYMIGKVAAVGEYPVTPDAMVAVVANEALARELMGESAKIELRATILTNSETPSGYQWSSSSGPPFKIAGGTRVNVSVVVDRRRPITYVLPIIRSTLGAT
jgi:HlyD family secretion protein